MDRKLGGLIFALFSGSAAAAPFCVVYSGGSVCNYSDYAYCVQSARSMGGMCTANTQTQPATPPQTELKRTQPDPWANQPRSNIYDNMRQSMQDAQDARNAAIRRRQDQEEHEARMRILDAEASKASQLTLPAQDPSKGWETLANAAEASVGKRKVIYTCLINGTYQLTDLPNIGCIVYGFGSPIP